MVIKVLQFLALFLLMLITGIFWGTWFALARSITQFSPAEFIHIGQVIIANVALPMRIIMPLTLFLMLISVLFSGKKTVAGFYSGVLALLLIVVVLLITLMILVPINNSISTWNASSLPEDWVASRNRWAAFHALRTFSSLAAFALFSAFVLNQPSRR